jgi:type I restriction enzyme S subunit
VAPVAFSSVDKKSVEGELPVRLCNYTDVFYNRRIRAEMDFMAATANPVERNRWSLKRGDVLFTKDSETPDEIGIPAFVEADMPNVLCGYHLGLARPDAQLLDGAYLAEAFASPKLAVHFARIANGVTRFGLTLGATNQLPIPLPSLAEQQAIAGLLDGVDVTVGQAKREQDTLRLLKESTADALLTGRVRVEVSQ